MKSSKNIFNKNVKNFKNSMNWEFAGLTPAEKLAENLDRGEWLPLSDLSLSDCERIADELSYRYHFIKSENNSILTSAIWTMEYFKDSFDHQRMIMALMNYIDLDYSRD